MDPTVCASPSADLGLGGFGVGRSPASRWRPYADDSPFNQSLSRAGRGWIRPRPPSCAADRLGRARGAAGGRDRHDLRGAGSIPSTTRTRTFPGFEVHLHLKSRGTCEVEGMRVRIPDNVAARPAAGSDGHLTVVDEQWAGSTTSGR